TGGVSEGGGRQGAAARLWDVKERRGVHEHEAIIGLRARRRRIGSADTSQQPVLRRKARATRQPNPARAPWHSVCSFFLCTPSRRGLAKHWGGEWTRVPLKLTARSGEGCP